MHLCIAAGSKVALFSNLPAPGLSVDDIPQVVSGGRPPSLTVEAHGSNLYRCKREDGAVSLYNVRLGNRISGVAFYNNAGCPTTQVVRCPLCVSVVVYASILPFSRREWGMRACPALVDSLLPCVRTHCGCISIGTLQSLFPATRFYVASEDNICNSHPPSSTYTGDCIDHL